MWVYLPLFGDRQLYLFWINAASYIEDSCNQSPERNFTNSESNIILIFSNRFTHLFVEQLWQIG